MTRLFLFLLVVPVLLSAQTEEKVYKNSVFLEFSHFKSKLKKYPETETLNQIYKFNYYRLLLNKELVKLNIGAGIGFYGKEINNGYGFFEKMITSLYFKSFFGRDKHLGFIGAGSILSPYYWDVDFYIPIGYQFKIVPKLSGFISFSQLIMSFDGETTWIWDSYSNTYTIDAGLGLNF
jgi:hypothetical protein